MRCEGQALSGWVGVWASVLLCCGWVYESRDALRRLGVSPGCGFDFSFGMSVDWQLCQKVIFFSSLWFQEFVECWLPKGGVSLFGKVNVFVVQLCPTVCDPMDSSWPDFSVHGIFQARVLEWVAMLSSRGSSRPGNQTWVSCIADRFLTIWATLEARLFWKVS